MFLIVRISPAFALAGMHATICAAKMISSWCYYSDNIVMSLLHHEIMMKAQIADKISCASQQGYVMQTIVSGSASKICIIKKKDVLWVIIHSLKILLVFYMFYFRLTQTLVLHLLKVWRVFYVLICLYNKALKNFISMNEFLYIAFKKLTYIVAKWLSMLLNRWFVIPWLHRRRCELNPYALRMVKTL